jgi:uncharacterized protein
LLNLLTYVESSFCNALQITDVVTSIWRAVSAKDRPWSLTNCRANIVRTCDCVLVTSPAILWEVAHVLHSPHIQRRFQSQTDLIQRFFRLVFRKAVLTQDLYATDRLATDPTDNKFLAAALEGQADFIVSWDPHLLDLKHFHTIQIVDVPAFVRVVRQSTKNRQ